MLSLKDDSINIAHISPGMLFGLMVANETYAAFGYECVVTSANDGIHSGTSLHYANSAVDLRTRHMADQHKEQIAEAIKRRLNIDYDVILEADHIHLELQPRRRDG